MQIRKATEADREFLWDLHLDTMRQYVAETWGWRGAEQRRLFDAAFTSRTPDIIELDGIPIGHLAVASLPDRLRLVSMEIAPAHQNRGLGTRLVEDLIARARDAGLPVDLRVLRVNPALRWYERLGFSVVSETRTHFVMEHPGGSGRAAQAHTRSP